MKIGVRIGGISNRVGAAAIARLKARIAERVRLREAIEQGSDPPGLTSDR